MSKSVDFDGQKSETTDLKDGKNFPVDKVLDEVCQFWAEQSKNIHLADKKLSQSSGTGISDIRDRLTGVAEGLIQAGKDGIEFLAKDPYAVNKSIGKTVEAIITTGQFVAKKISAEEGGALVQEISKVTIQAGDDYLKLSPKEQGRIFGHDVLPVVIPQLPNAFQIMKKIDQASEAASAIGNIERKATQLSTELEKPLAQISKEANEIEGHLSHGNGDSIYSQESERIFVRQSGSDYDAGGPRAHGAGEEARYAENPPSDLFLEKLDDVYERLLPNEKDFLIEKGVRVIGVRRAIDISNEVDETTKGFYDPKNRTIYLAEKYDYARRWIANDKLDHTLKHEIGHAINDLSRSDGKLVSDDTIFKGAYNQDTARLSSKQLNDLKLLHRETWDARDEVFARFYAITGGLAAIDDKFYEMRKCFPACLRWVKEFKNAERL